MPQVDSICISEKKGELKSPVESAEFVKDSGIAEDAHAGKWHRQVSLLSRDDIEMVRKHGLPDIKPGDFAENVVISGFDFSTFGLGTRFRLGRDIILSVTQIGKVCHAPCRIQQLTGFEQFAEDNVDLP